MRTYLRAVGGILAAICLVETQGCRNRQVVSGETENSSYTTVDSWYHPAPPSTQSHNVTELKESEIYEVTDTTELQAESLLKQLSVIPLSFEQATTFTQGRFRAIGTSSPYLVRAVYLNRGTGAFLVSQQANIIFVHHGSLGHSAVPMKRKALVVQLRTAPSEVFVDCSMAE